MNARANAAVLYAAERQWSVFPCRGKIPLTSNGFKAATSDVDQILEWAEKWPEANWGVATGEHFDVLDLDDARQLDPEILRAIMAMDGPAAVTGGGGLHCYVQPTGMGNRAKFLPGVDFRGQGGYVILPPALHDSGQQYEWVDGLTPGTPIPPAPDWLLKALMPPSPTSTRATSALLRPKDGYTRAAVQGELDSILRAPEGCRNDTLNTAALKVGSLVGAGLLNETTATTMLVQAGLAIGLGEREVESTVRSGLRAGMASPRVVAP